jgi:hypothetical protein
MLTRTLHRRLDDFGSFTLDQASGARLALIDAPIQSLKSWPNVAGT